MGAGRILAGAILDLGGQVGEAFRGGARVGQGVLVGEVEEVLLQVQVVTHFLDHVHQLLADDRRLGFYQVEAVGEYLALLGGVDQGGTDAQLGAAQHGGQQLGTVFHVHHHGVAFLQADGGQVVGDAVGPGIELLVGELPVLVEDGDAVGVAVGGLFESHPQAQRRVGVGDLAHLGAFDQTGQITENLGNLGQKLGQRNDVGAAHGISIVCVLGMPGSSREFI